MNYEKGYKRSYVTLLFERRTSLFIKKFGFILYLENITVLKIDKIK
jgi:hypothetical protein